MFPFESDPTKLYNQQVIEFSDDYASPNRPLFQDYDPPNPTLHHDPIRKKNRKDTPRMLQQWEVFSQDPHQGVVIKQTINCRSLAWIVFRQADDSLNAWCRICGQRKRARKGNTTNLLHHIQNQHWQIFCRLQTKIKMKQKYPQNVINLCEDVLVKISESGIQLQHRSQQNSQLPLEIRTLEYKDEVMPRRRSLQDQSGFVGKQNEVGQAQKKRKRNRKPASTKQPLANDNPDEKFNSHQNTIQQMNEYPQFQENLQKHQRYSSVIDYRQGMPISNQISSDHYQHQPLTKYQESIEAIKDRRYLEQLRNEPNLQMIEIYEDNRIISLILINEQMRENLTHYPETIGFWQIPNPTLLSHIENSIIVCGQNSQMMPRLFGVAIIFKQTEDNFVTIFNSFYQRYITMKKEWPLVTVTCGTQLLQLLGNKFLRGISSDQNYRLIHLQQQVLFSQNKQLGSILRRTRAFEVLAEGREKASFIGFCLTSSYIDQIINFTPSKILIQPNLTSYIQKVFELMETQPQRIQCPFPQQIKRESIQKHECLAECHKHMPTQIFHKLLASFLYSKYSLHLKLDGIHGQQCQVFQISADIPFNYQPLGYEVKFNAQSQKWECRCRLESWVGIPCPHIIKVLIHNKSSLLPYIATKWLNNHRSNCSDEKQGHMKEQQSPELPPQTINNYVAIRKQENTGLQTYSQRQFDSVSSQNYLDVFWS